MPARLYFATIDFLVKIIFTSYGLKSPLLHERKAMNHHEEDWDEDAPEERTLGLGALVVYVMIYPILAFGWLEQQAKRLVSSQKDYVTSEDPSVLPYGKLIEGGTRQGLVLEPPRYK